ncbi:hypothetical protein GCM10010174_43110 [Kutzneria viridogrisea]|uniref:Uncharacterized protein n=2 Tax=Kutzneria TaxID=43356 RepID=W5WD42_9PSEU|nr:B-4DMT family transporter [Kutzneria albida]AHH96114.1 hypothetical protein KALB_2746 [Kutzneria albida DSM 43870]MBA8928680.1 hypothetical protein [Kutzneria viridogrisea]
MRAWLVRGAVVAAVHALVQTGVAALRAAHPDWLSVLRPVSLGLLVGVAVFWAGLDAWRGLERPAMEWFRAALLAGPVSGVLGVLLQGLLVDQTGVESVWAAITGGAAFTALLVLVPAVLGLGLGRLVGRRSVAQHREV